MKLLTKKEKVINRYPTIDFLRGAAIFTMLILHVINGTLNTKFYFDQIDSIGVIQIILLLVLPYLGGLAGLFLMVSAMANMISINHNLEKGYEVKLVVFKQIMGGFIIIIFAMLIESTIGYLGAFGNIFQHLNDLSKVAWNRVLYRAYHFETIHTIGWAMILNGITHGLLIKKYHWKNEWKKIVKSYWLLIVLVLVITPIVWNIIDYFIPGYPYAINPITNQPVQYPYIGKSPWYDFITGFFLIALSGSLEPILPYLATSYIGSIVAIIITQKKEDIPGNFFKRYSTIAILSIIIGYIGVLINIAHLISVKGLDAGIDMYLMFPYHRYFVPMNGMMYFGWFFQFITLNGCSLFMILVMLRLVEFRGRSKSFAKQSVFIRRFGFVALTVYTVQYIYFVLHYLVSLAFGLPPYSKLHWNGVIILLILTLLSFHVLLKLWEKVGYIGSIEWMIITLINHISKIKKQNALQDNNLKWWETGKLNVDGVFYNANWINIIDKDEIDHDNFSESKLSIYVSILGIFLFPFSFISYLIAHNSVNTEGRNKYNKLGYILSIVGIIFGVTWISLSFIISLGDLGISL